MTTPYLVVGFIVLAAAVVTIFVLLWRTDAHRAEGIAEDTDRLDAEPDAERRHD